MQLSHLFPKRYGVSGDFYEKRSINHSWKVVAHSELETSSNSYGNLQVFLGLTNYVSEYIKDYAKVAVPTKNKLLAGREVEKTGSKMLLFWEPFEIERFLELKKGCPHAWI